MKVSRFYHFLNSYLSPTLKTYFQFRYPNLDDFQVMLLVQGKIFQVYQLKFFVQDYLIKKPYKIIDCQCEFGAELKWYVPFAYWHYKNGTLLKTISSSQTKSLYYFSPEHQEVPRLRRYCTSYEIPNSEDHNFKYDLSKWTPPSYRSRYAHKKMWQFSKPILIISNKYTTQWGGLPVNFIKIETTLQLIDLLRNQFTIVYSRPTSDLAPQDRESETLDFNDKQAIKCAFADVLFSEDIYQSHQHEFRDYNEFQLALYSVCSNFISVQGGNSVLASYFGGKNLVYLAEGHEVRFGEYENFYHQLSGCSLTVVRSESELIEKTNLLFMNDVTNDKKAVLTKKPKIYDTRYADMSLDMSAWSSGQMDSKIWMCEVLETHLGTTQDYNVICFGGWYGLNAFVLLCRDRLRVNCFTNYDIDEHALETSLLINKAWTIGSQKYLTHLQDVNTLDVKEIIESNNKTSKVIFINTSIESIEGLTWWKNLPSNQLVLLQTCTLVASYCVGPTFTSLEHFRNIFAMKKTLFAGAKRYEYPDGSSYERFMILGVTP
ncbi:MAG: hypothetical protein ACK5P7_02780 [Bdellovibrio sp.]